MNIEELIVRLRIQEVNNDSKNKNKNKNVLFYFVANVNVTKLITIKTTWPMWGTLLFDVSKII